MTANPDLNGLIVIASTTCPRVAQAIETANKIGGVLARVIAVPTGFARI